MEVTSIDLSAFTKLREELQSIIIEWQKSNKQSLSNLITACINLHKQLDELNKKLK